MTETWWAPREIFFRKDQVLWLIKYLSMLIVGIWPPEPYGSSYTDAPGGKRQRRHQACFETPCQFAAEIEWRLGRTGTDGKLLRAEIKTGEVYLSQESKDALNYCSGWKRKKTPYASWLSSRVYYKNVTTTP